MKEFEDLLCDLVRNRPRKLLEKSPLKPEDQLVIHLLETALEEGTISEKQFRANVKITFLTAHENTQQLLNSAFWQLGHDLVCGEIPDTKTIGLTQSLADENE